MQRQAERADGSEHLGKGWSVWVRGRPCAIYERQPNRSVRAANLIRSLGER